MASPYPHYVWAGGHFLLLLSSLHYGIAWLRFKSGSYGMSYKCAFLGAITSYAIVVYKSLGTPQPNKAYVQRALADENFQYFLLAIFWWFSKPVPIALVPFITFSTFHALTFTRTNIIPVIFKPQAAAPGQQAPQHPIAKSIHAWVKKNYDLAMVFVAWAELALLVRTIIGAILFFTPFKNSLLIPLVIGTFLKIRYYHSAFTRGVVEKADAMITARVNQPDIPPAARQAWTQGRTMIARWGTSSVVQPQAAPAEAAAGAPGRR